MVRTTVAFVVFACLVARGDAQERQTTELRIVVEPEGVELWQGSLQLGVVGNAPMKLAVEPGRVAYRFVKEGYATEERSIEIGSEPTTLVVRLKPVAAPNPHAPAVQPVEGAKANAATTAKHSHKGLALGIAGGAVAVGVGTALALKKPDPLTVDDDHDGYTEQQGDCNDADPQVKPNGPFSINVTPSVVGSVNCNATYNTIVFRVTNLGCETVTVNSVTWASAHTSGSTCFGGNFTETIPLSVSSVTPGSRDLVIATRFISGTVGCCGSSGFCGNSDVLCGWQETYTVNTSRGLFPQGSSYTITFPRGNSCSVCPSATSEIQARSCKPEPF
jgi:hypothetical protein